MSQINFKDETLDASDGVTKLLLAAEYWKEKASALRAKIAEMEQQEPARLVTATAYRWRYRGAVKWQYGELTDETVRRAKEHNHEVQPLYALPGAQPAPNAVAYLDIGAGGYMDIGTDLTDEELAALPKGRHMLGVIGTYGVDGYVPAHKENRNEQ